MPDSSFMSIIFRKAKNLISKSNSFTFTLAKAFIPSKKIKFFYCWYAYLRWVDDIADSNNTPLSERIAFISSQMDLIEKLYSESGSLNLSNEHEEFLFMLV